MPYGLYVKGTDTRLGEISDAQRQTLIDLLEEEDADDRDYYVDQAVLDYMAEQGADPALLALLRPHVGPDAGIEVEWREE
jgi:hypothetical protein